MRNGVDRTTRFSTPCPVVVNADDFGLTAGVSRGILFAHETGSVTSTSALVVAPAFDKYSRALRDSGLPVGAHLGLVGVDRPVLSSREIPTLVDSKGRLPKGWIQFLARAARGAVDMADVHRECRAQVDVLRSTGIEPTHLDTHQNVHLWPEVASVVLDLADSFAIPAVRVPRTTRLTPIGVGVRPFSALLDRRACSSGLKRPDATVHLDQIGQHSVERLANTLHGYRRSGVTSVEIIAHLALAPDPQRSRYPSRFDWEAQFRMVTDPDLCRALQDGGFERVSYRDLSGAAPATSEHIEAAVELRGCER